MSDNSKFLGDAAKISKGVLISFAPEARQYHM